MKVHNFNKGNYQYVGTGSEVYYGKIVMTYPEFCTAVKFLMRARLGASYEQAFYKKILKEDLQNKEAFKGGFNVRIRVTATEKLFKKFELPRYKKQNYFVQVLTPKTK